MFKIKTFVPVILLAVALMMVAGCTGPSSVANPPVQPGPSSAKPVTPPDAGTSASVPVSSNRTTAATPTSPTDTNVPVRANHLEVVYFHMNQRCVTCLCFEERVNEVLETYFSDAINSGRLVYRVLNAQDPQNAALARKYKAVGSQLFLNSVVNGFDNIDDIQEIWDWNCRTDQGGFDSKVKNAVEQRLKVLG